MTMSRYAERAAVLRPSAGRDRLRGDEKLEPAEHRPWPDRFRASTFRRRSRSDPGRHKMPVDQQPVTLVVENASTNGQRPLTYLFEVATDTGFTNQVFVREGVTPGEAAAPACGLPDRSRHRAQLLLAGPCRGRRQHQPLLRTGRASTSSRRSSSNPPPLVSPAINAVLSTAAADVHLQQRDAIGPRRADQLRDRGLGQRLLRQ